MAPRQNLCRLVFAAVLTMLLAGGAAGTDFYWDGGTGSWSTSTNWNPDGEPTASDDAYINNAGTAQVSVPDEVCAALYLGYSSADSGTVEVGAGGVLSARGPLYLGHSGAGTLDITNGGQVWTWDWVSGSSYLGYHSGSSGAVTVDGSGSTWSNDQSLYVGRYGVGSLDIQNGGAVSNMDAYLGYIGGSSGTVTVDGSGSTWRNWLWLVVGHSSAGTLDITNGGAVSSGDAILGGLDGSSGTVTVDGSGSTWSNSSDLVVGYEECTGTLDIQNGGAVANSDGYLGYYSGGSGTVTVDGSGSTWSNSADLYVGLSGVGILDIQNGGAVSNTNAYLGRYSGGSGTATVDGSGSTWSSSSGLYLGGGSTAAGGTGLLTVQNGGSVEVDGMTKLWSAGTLTLDGGTMTTGSFDSSAGTFNHHDGTLTVSGGSFNDGTANLLVEGQDAADLATLVLDDATVVGSYHKLTVGNNRHGALTLSNGTVLSNTSSGYLGHESGSSGTVTVDGAGSTWSNVAELMVGNGGQGVLNIQNGGSVSSIGGYVGDNTGSSGTVTVDGAGSTWSSAADVCVGNGGQGVLNIQNGGSVSSLGGAIGGFVLSTVTVDGADSTWSNTEYLAVGWYLGQGILNIQNGGAVSSAGGYLGWESGSSGTVTVDGSGSTWTNSGELYVGHFGAGTLDITNGGAVSNSYGHLGYDSGGSGTVTVDGNGSTWTNSSYLYVGREGTGTLDITNGGAVSDFDGHLGYFSGSSGTATVDGSGSTWTNSSYLYVGRSGVGSLDITNGGAVSSTHGRLGYVGGSSGTVRVDGSGSTWSNSGDLYLGGSKLGAGGSGSVTVSDGGQLTVAGTLNLWDGGALTIDGSALAIPTLEGTTGGLVRISDPTSDVALTLGDGSNATYSGSMGDAGAGAGSLRKVGAGTQTLAGPNTWTGATYVDEGILALPQGLSGGPGGDVMIASGAELQGGGYVGRRVTGNGTVTATSDLLAGDMTSTDGWDFAGTLNVGSNHVLLLDSDVAELGELATLGDGGELDSLNGAQLGPASWVDPAKTVVATADAMIGGAFRNNGTVNGPSGSDWLTFTDHVNGAGSFTGNIRLRDGYSPGNSAAAVSFENLALEGALDLCMELGGLVQGDEYDHLDVSGDLFLDGTLDVTLISGFDPSLGDSFDLFDWAALTGAFDAVNLPTLAPELLWDTAALYDTGIITAGAVPEPGTLALFGLGLAAVALRRRRRRQ